MASTVAIVAVMLVVMVHPCRLLVGLRFAQAGDVVQDRGYFRDAEGQEFVEGDTSLLRHHSDAMAKSLIHTHSILPDFRPEDSMGDLAHTFW